MQRLLEEWPIAEIPKVPHWSENFALAGFDPKSGIDVFLHIGRWRKNLSLWREIVTIALPDGSVITHRGIGNGLASAAGAGGANLCVRVVEPYRRQTWRFAGAGRRVASADLLNDIVGNGPENFFEFEFAYSSELPVWDLGHVGETTEFMGRGHIEQLGRAVGSIKFGTERYEFDSMVNRDHSRGPRLVDDMQRHTWMHGVFGDDLAFLCYEAETKASGVAYSEACVYERGVLHPAVLQLGFRLPMQKNLTELEAPVPFSIKYRDRTLRVQTLSFPTTIGYHYTSPWDFYIGRRSLGDGATRGSVEQSLKLLLDEETPGYGHMERTIPGEVIRES